MDRTIKMIGLDLDGTLLNPQKELTDYTAEVLKKAINKGVTVLAATGRPLSGVPKELLTFPGMRYVLTSNGARIVDLQQNRVVYESLLPKEKGREVLEVFSRYDTFREIYYDGTGYVDKEQIQHLNHYLKEMPMARYILSTRVPVQDIMELLHEDPRDFDKVQALFASIEEKNKALADLAEIEGIAATGALENNIEVNNQGVSKGLGLITLGSMLGITREEIMACGDGMNDLGMMREVGFGIAMENGAAEVKEAADYITGTNEEDGAAKAIEKFVLA